MTHVTAIGLGNIGSHLVAHLGRLPGIRRVTLIDKDRYETKNLSSQDIDVAAAGRPKAAVQTLRLRRINPQLQIDAIAEPIENLPLGRLRASLILTCLDSRRSRQYVNQAAWRLGIPWIDAGVEPGGLLARVNGYLPADENPCLECAWSDEDYELLETSYPCDPDAPQSAATNAPSGLGALAASLQILEAQKFLAGQVDQVVISRQVMIDASQHKHYLTSFRRNPYCRFDHATWKVDTLAPGSRKKTLREILNAASRDIAGNDPAPWLSVEGQPFVTKLTCTTCDSVRPILRLRCSLSPRDQSCSKCGRALVFSGWDLAERLTTHLPKKKQCRSLRSLGLRPGEIFTIGGSHHEQHFEIACDRM